MKKRVFALLLAGALCAGLAACGQSTQDTTAAADTAAEADTEAAASEDAEAADTEAADAAETTGSGKVTVYMPSPAGLADKLAEAFTAETGIQVEQFQGTTGEILARLETEAANPVADVVILASWSDGLTMKEDGQIMSYTPANADLVNEGWIDEDGEPVKSAVVEMADEGERKAAEATEELAILMDAWLHSGHTLAFDFPAIRIDELRQHLRTSLGWSRDRVKKAFSGDRSSRFLGKLYLSGMVQAMDDLLVIMDGVWATCCFLTLEGIEKSGAHGAQRCPNALGTTQERGV